MTLTTTRALRALLLVASAAASLAAQVPVQVGLQLDGAGIRVRGVSTALATGTLLGGRGSATFGPVRLSLSYREGRLHDGSTRPFLVEGGAAADVQLAPWIAVGLGPEARAYKLDSASLRRVWLAGRVGIAAPLIGTAVRTDVRLWRSVATSAASSDLTQVAGGEVGIGYYSAAARWWIRLATTFDDAAFAGPRHERSYGLSLGAGIGR
ncbi:MAG TPA: hypothetical protein VFP39_11890 [Gemmatimonadales bacterium]|nr:hypothetical protein [Gemmatimonadales bacterium]